MNNIVVSPREAKATNVETIGDMIEKITKLDRSGGARFQKLVLQFDDDSS